MLPLSQHGEEDLKGPPILVSLAPPCPLLPSVSLILVSLSPVHTLCFLTPKLSSAQGLCAQLHLQGFSTVGVCGGPRGIRLPPDTSPTPQGPTPAQLKLFGMWRCLSMPAGASTAPLGPLGLRACGDTIPGLRQDHPLPALCAVARSEAHICPSHPACVDICDWEEAGNGAMSITPLPSPYNLPDPTQAPSHSLNPFHWELKVIGKPSDNFPTTWDSLRDLIVLLNLISLSVPGVGKDS